MLNRTKLLPWLLVWYGLLWTVLAIAPHDRQDWLLENLLALAGVATLVITYRRFQFSTVSYLLITTFLSLHAVGAHYTYAEVPYENWTVDGSHRIEFLYSPAPGQPARPLVLRHDDPPRIAERCFVGFVRKESGNVAQVKGLRYTGRMRRTCRRQWSVTAGS